MERACEVGGWEILAGDARGGGGGWWVERGAWGWGGMGESMRGSGGGGLLSWCQDSGVVCSPSVVRRAGECERASSTRVYAICLITIYIVSAARERARASHKIQRDHLKARK